jgi:hypothetical protein
MKVQVRAMIKDHGPDAFQDQSTSVPQIVALSIPGVSRTSTGRQRAEPGESGARSAFSRADGDQAMHDEQAAADVRALHRAPELNHPFAADLTNLSAEQAATALVDRFAETGYAQADVADPVTVRKLIRRDCRRRQLPVRTYGVGAIVVAIDEDRNDTWLASPDGAEYQEQMSDAALAALSNIKPPRWSG